MSTPRKLQVYEYTWIFQMCKIYTHLYMYTRVCPFNSWCSVECAIWFPDPSHALTQKRGLVHIEAFLGPKHLCEPEMFVLGKVHSLIAWLCGVGVVNCVVHVSPLAQNEHFLASVALSGPNKIE